MATSLTDLLEALKAQQLEAAGQGYLELRQGNESVKLPGPKELAEAARILREEAALGDDRQIFQPLTQDH